MISSFTEKEVSKSAAFSGADLGFKYLLSLRMREVATPGVFASTPNA
jgi:hypothetical protein